MSFNMFYTGLTAGTVALVLSLTVYIWNANATTIQLQQTSQDERIERTETDLRQIREIVIRLDSYIQYQVELNEWFVSESKRTNKRSR